MIKLQDFAKQQGVTDRAIQKHLKTYADEFEGLFQRKGPNGTWLTDEACELLRSKMKQAPATVFQEDPRVATLEGELKELRRQLDLANENFQKYVANTSAMVAKANEQLLLAEQSEANLERAKLAEKQAVESRKREIETAAALERTKEDLKTAEDVAEANGQELELMKREKTELEDELKRLKNRNLWQRIFNKE